MYTRRYKYKYNYKWYITPSSSSLNLRDSPIKARCIFRYKYKYKERIFLQIPLFFSQCIYVCSPNLDASLETNKDKKCILLQIPTIWQNLGLVPSFLIRCRLCNMFNVQCNMYNIKTKCIWSKFPQSNKSMNGLAGNLLLWVQSPTSSFLTLGCILPAFKEKYGLENWFLWISEPHS